MAEGFVSFGVEKLWDLLSRESERLQGLDDQVDGLKRQLTRLQSLLKDADAKKHGSERVRNFLEDVKDLVYDAEDILESYVLNKSRGKEKGIKKHVRRLACFLTDRRKVASDIEGITKRISEVIGDMQSLGIQQVIDGGRSMSLQDRQREQREIRQTYANSPEHDLVGVEQSVEELVGHLVENDKHQVVSISGMGGIGKSTLARQVFHHDIVRRHFDGFAWVCVSQQFTQKHVWQRILQELQPHDGEILQMDEYALQGKLFQLLQTGRYLVVLDDVWKKEDWDRIKAVFPQQRGWKMLLTSRNEGVGIHVDPTCFTFKARILNPNESWKLCERIVFSRRDETACDIVQK
ncbi:disease resistance protein RPH8A [Arabidopsis lyrata subsp. lyrata]|uniref:disease resistance protein RPH8A n=1 Tax=Arabidopsis lyrata subsp. lyrata TaxID=81972 RepID=UPI000A29A7B6|nr:disease resistance protein RPH8A [Arabidopsis lyrata subsp. lyrata]|eukprot:XP_020871446.1 disease resistance protein RPH8A [Arabidopsis lyrata subsp. lyrata]